MGYGAFDQKPLLTKVNSLDYKVRKIYQSDNKVIVGTPLLVEPLFKVIKDTPTNVPGSIIVYGNGIYVGVKTGANLSSSYDGITWTTRTATGDINYVGFISGLFVAYGAAGTTNRTYYTSPDGINWTTRTQDFSAMGTDPSLGSPVTVNNVMVISAFSNGRFYYSSDGTTWTAGTWPVDPFDGGNLYILKGITYSQGLYCFMFEYYSNTSYPFTPCNYLIYTAPNFSTFTYRSQILTTNPTYKTTKGPDNFFSIKNVDADFIMYALYTGTVQNLFKSVDGGITFVPMLNHLGTVAETIETKRTMLLYNKFVFRVIDETYGYITQDGVTWYQIKTGINTTTTPLAAFINVYIDNPLNMISVSNVIYSANPYQVVIERP